MSPTRTQICCAERSDDTTTQAPFVDDSRIAPLWLIHSHPVLVNQLFCCSTTMQGLYAAHRKNPLTVHSNSSSASSRIMPLHSHHDRRGASNNNLVKPIVGSSRQEEDPALVTVVDAHAINFDLFCMGRTSLLGPAAKNASSSSSSLLHTVPPPPPPQSSNNKNGSSVPVIIEDDSNVAAKDTHHQSRYYPKGKKTPYHGDDATYESRSPPPPRTVVPPSPRATSADLLEALARSAAAGALREDHHPIQALRDPEMNTGGKRSRR